MEFKNIEDFQAALNGYVSVAEWEILTAAIQIPEECFPLAYARLADLTSQVRIEVSLFWLISRSISFSWLFFSLFPVNQLHDKLPQKKNVLVISNKNVMSRNTIKHDFSMFYTLIKYGF